MKPAARSLTPGRTAEVAAKTRRQAEDVTDEARLPADPGARWRDDDDEIAPIAWLADSRSEPTYGAGSANTDHLQTKPADMAGRLDERSRRIVEARRFAEGDTARCTIWRPNSAFPPNAFARLKPRRCRMRAVGG